MTNHNTVIERQRLRQTLRKARQSLTTEQQQQASERVLAMALQANILPSSGSCAFYLVNDGELNPIKLIQHCWMNGITTSLPVIHPFTKGHLLFVKYSAQSRMQVNQYGISEPRCELPNIVPMQQHRIIFLPLVGFDNAGNRLGMGGGYYDRTLASLTPCCNTTLVGLAHDCQQVDALPQQSWDIPLDMIITPGRIINC